MKVDIFMPWFFGDYIKDTADLTAEEHGAYMLLLGHMWNRGGRLPADPERLSRLAAVTAKRWAGVWATIGRFFDEDGGEITQRRLAAELSKALDLRAEASRAGKASAEARRSKYGSAQPSNGTRTVVRTELERPFERPFERSSEKRSERTPNSSPSPSEKTGGDPERAPPNPIWAPSEWLRKFGIAWQRKYQNFYGQSGDPKTCSTLEGALDRLPRDEILRCQSRADEMFAEFFAGTSPVALERKHPFSFFVGDFGTLRVSDGPKKAAQTSPALERARAEWAGR